jgi:hypothetical protein
MLIVTLSVNATSLENVKSCFFQSSKMNCDTFCTAGIHDYIYV